jgi:hypothetical protein
MANEFYFYTTPIGSELELRTDAQGSYVANPHTDNRPDGQVIILPQDLETQGANLVINSEGYEEFSVRGILKPSLVCPHCATVLETQAFFWLDDVHLKEKESAPPPTPIPPPTTSNRPEDIINEVYATGKFNLYTKEGCGLFTEACCVELHNRNNNMWGHVKKNPGQNQFNGHAVDAVMCLAGEENGIWDIIVSSESSSAHPAYNRAGDIKPELWYYPAAPYVPPTRRR